MEEAPELFGVVGLDHPELSIVASKMNARCGYGYITNVIWCYTLYKCTNCQNEKTHTIEPLAPTRSS